MTDQPVPDDPDAPEPLETWEPWRPFVPMGNHRYGVRLPTDVRELLKLGLEDLRNRMLGPNPSTERLFPPAYRDRPDLDAEYQEMMHGELLESRLTSVEIAEEALTREEVTDDELVRWMQSVNALRLVIGTELGVDEEMVDLDPDDAPRLAFYELLGAIVAEMVAALSTGLGPPTARDVDR